MNLELDRASCLHRFKDVYAALGLAPKRLENIDIWNLRGNSVPMDKLAPKLIRRAYKKNYIAVIIDPIYKVITGDENSADQMAHFCNQFDKICTELNAAVVYCHHHSKGYQGAKRSMDRASGSGVFARDPDALLDLVELDAKDIGGMKGKTAWRIEGTLREYAKFEPLNLYFEYPVHRVDKTGFLDGLKAESDKPGWEKAKDNRKSPQQNKEERRRNIEAAFEAASFNGRATVQAMAEYLGKSEKTVRNYLKECKDFWVTDSEVGKK